MSEQGWQAFLAAPDVGDWVVLHGGATAVFAVATLGEAARLAEAVAKIPGVEGSGMLLTLADDQVTVRLTRDVWGSTAMPTSREPSRLSRDSMAQLRTLPVRRRCSSP